MKPDRNSYTALEFSEWKASGALVLAPKFQRRNVWTTPKKSFLIDTVLRGLPIPPIYLRVGQNKEKTRTIREVIDGQQRISAVVDYLNDDFVLSRALEAAHAGKKFSKLNVVQQDQIRTYAFNCESFSGLADSTVLEIFTRMNTYSVQLNAQELRNGKYFGFFKQISYKVARQYLEFWRQNHIVTEPAIARMQEVEVVSELLVAQLDGLQDKKNSIDDFYSRYDEEMPNSTEVAAQCSTVLDEISETFSGELQELEWRRRPLFYTLFCVIFHRIFGMPGRTESTPKRKKLTKADRAALHDAAIALSEILVRAKDGEPTNPSNSTFVNASLTQTDNIKPRTARFSALYRRAFP